MTQLADQTAAVTGANRGLGREFVHQLLERGVTKVYAAARDPKTIDATDPRVVPPQPDVTDPDSVARVAELTDAASLLVNNAGILTGAPVVGDDTPGLRREDSVTARSGVVVNVASVLSWLALGGSYSVSKAALWSATNLMRLQLGPHDVQVVGVYRGYVDADMARAVRSSLNQPAGARYAPVLHEAV